MDAQLVIALAAGLVLGLLVGAIVSWMLASARRETGSAQNDTHLAQTRTELANAQTHVAQARGEASQARSEVAQARTDTARAQGDLAGVRAEAAQSLSDARADAAQALASARVVADRALAESRAETASAQGEAAEVGAQVARAEAQRDAARLRATELAADRVSMLNQFKVLSTETIERQGKLADASADARLRATEQVMGPVKESLDKFNARLNDVEKERVAMSTDLKAQVQAVQQTGETLRRETGALVTALRKPQIRGSWGETQLKRVAEISGMVERCDFDLQHTAKSDGVTVRPDMKVNLAEGKHIFVDSKVPLSAFLDAAETEDDTLKRHYLANYVKNVRTHVDQLSSKQYWKAAETPEFVVLFLPNETFFAAALDLMPDLYEYAASRDVVLATPTTLIGMLRAVAYGWKQAALAESAAEVFKLGRDLHDKLGLMGNRFDKLGRALRTSVNAYNETIATVEGTVLVRARKFRDLKVSEKELTALSSVDEPVRQIQAPELVDDAVRVEPLVGRSSRRSRTSSDVPEADQLMRREPDLLELLNDEVDETEKDRRTGS